MLQVYRTAKPSASEFPLAAMEDFVEELRGIRERGFAASVEERIPGAQAVGSVVFGARNDVVGGICVTFPRDRLPSFSIEEMAAVSKAAHELSALLGAKGR